MVSGELHQPCYRRSAGDRRGREQPRAAQEHRGARAAVLQPGLCQGDRHRRATQPSPRAASHLRGRSASPAACPCTPATAHRQNLHHQPPGTLWLRWPSWSSAAVPGGARHGAVRLADGACGWCGLPGGRASLLGYRRALCLRGRHALRLARADQAVLRAAPHGGRRLPHLRRRVHPPPRLCDVPARSLRGAAVHGSGNHHAGQPLVLGRPAERISA
mmetsp:Transcript_57237/g.137630  ORF Transcript_57237/g.137630 Transcript_57237/m.137630 type:complete len:217 (-) Transcript_57237:360-1010(-)